MSKTYVPRALQQLVRHRAHRACEYCLIHDDDSLIDGQIDHIISEKHGGETNADNLAYACVFCNRAKGSDIGSIDWETKEFSRFFNPRTDNWEMHFWLDGVLVMPLTIIGKVTIRLLDINSVDRLIERQALQEVGRYPSSEVRERLRHQGS